MISFVSSSPTSSALFLEALIRWIEKGSRLKKGENNWMLTVTNSHKDLLQVQEGIIKSELKAIFGRDIFEYFLHTESVSIVKITIKKLFLFFL